MLRIPRNVCLVPSFEVWWPDGPDSVLALLREVPLVTVRGCPDEIAGPLEQYSFRRKPALTLLFDLTVPTDELWRGLRRKSCRQDINKALKHEPEIVVNDDIESVFHLINDHIRRKGYRPPLGRAEWDRIRSHGDVFSIRCRGTLVAAHAVLVDGALRARATVGGEVDRMDERFPSITGPMNRLLHWHEMNYYKHRGVRQYDFGGLVLDETSPMYEISRFKLSFGGEPVSENVLQLWRGATGRRVLRELAARDGTRGVLHSVVQAGGQFRSMSRGYESTGDGSPQGKESSWRSL